MKQYLKGFREILIGQQSFVEEGGGIIFNGRINADFHTSGNKPIRNYLLNIAEKNRIIINTMHLTSDIEILYVSVASDRIL